MSLAGTLKRIHYLSYKIKISNLIEPTSDALEGIDELLYRVQRLNLQPIDLVDYGAMVYEESN